MVGMDHGLAPEVGRGRDFGCERRATGVRAGSRSPQMWVAWLAATLPWPAAAAPPSPLVLGFERTSEAIRDAAALTSALLPRGLARLPPEALLPHLLWSVDPGPRRSAGALGLAPDRPTRIALAPDLGAALVELPLSRPDQFLEWLDRLPAPSRTRVEVAPGRVAVVLAPGHPLPLACVVEAARALCQLGAAPEGIAPLARALSSGVQAPVLSAEEPHRDGWVAALEPLPLARALLSRWAHQERLAHRLHPPVQRRLVERRIRAVEQRVLAAARAVTAAEARFVSQRGAPRLGLTLTLTADGHRRLDRWLGRPGGETRVRSWTATPSLFSLFVAANPRVAAALLRAAGTPVSASALDGAFGLVALGLDASCPQARHPDRLGWLFLFPSAVAFGLRGEPAADEAYAALNRAAAPSSIAQVSLRPRLRVPLAEGELGVQVLDDLVLFGSGPMATRAGLRRLARVEPSRPPEGTFLDVRLDLGALLAALDAARVDEEHPWALRWLARVVQDLRPSVQGLRRLRLVGVRVPETRTLRLEFAAER